MGNSKITSVGIIGSGTMGAGIAEIAASNFHPEESWTDIERIQKYCDDMFEKQNIVCKKKKI